MMTRTIRRVRRTRRETANKNVEREKEDGGGGAAAK